MCWRMDVARDGWHGVSPKLVGIRCQAVMSHLTYMTADGAMRLLPGMLMPSIRMTRLQCKSQVLA